MVVSLFLVPSNSISNAFISPEIPDRTAHITRMAIYCYLQERYDLGLGNSDRPLMNKGVLRLKQCNQVEPIAFRGSRVPRSVGRNKWLADRACCSA